MLKKRLIYPLIRLLLAGGYYAAARIRHHRQLARLLDHGQHCIGCVDMGGEVYLAGDKQQTNGASLLILPGLVELICGALTLSFVFVLILTAKNGVRQSG
jgi:hypothetical protein